VEQNKILSRILFVRIEKHQENVSQVTRTRGGGLNVGSPKYESGVLPTGQRYSIDSLDHKQIYIYFELTFSRLMTYKYVIPHR
jgi:hypothetical protein